ncbi:MAG: bacteriohemerythrin [Spirochaetia bacterium]|nr:bacteriohemerythrin [Spirochaetia bacterium]
MNSINWNDDIKLGIKEIDDQHFQFVNILNNLKTALLEETSKDTIKQLVHTLILYTTTHFRLEEIFFDKFSYEFSTEHKTEHKAFTDKIMKIKNDYFDDKIEITNDIIELFNNMILEHINDSDKKFAEYYFKNK